MRIGILTQPLYTNYGGLVQCYALQTILQHMGHQTVILQREFVRKYSLMGAIWYYAKHIIKWMRGWKSSWHYYVDPKRREYIACNTKNFITDYIHPLSQKCYSSEDLAKQVQMYHLDAIIVGSDQVWRPNYSPCLSNYFLDFLPQNSAIRRISYAASFGTDDWTFSEEETRRCSQLMKLFSYVSVREQSAVGLCKEKFGVDAVHTLDPTLLLDQTDYRCFIKQKVERGQLFCYMLDRNKDKRNVILKVAEKSGLLPFETMPEYPDYVYYLYDNIDKCIYPPVEDWLSSFAEAEMVVTDSFHGTVFSIIFNKPFWVVGNKRRGLARFESLLSTFGLQERIVDPLEIQNIDVNKPIDWAYVNDILHDKRTESINFIINALK